MEVIHKFKDGLTYYRRSSYAVSIDKHMALEGLLVSIALGLSLLPLILIPISLWNCLHSQVVSPSKMADGYQQSQAFSI